MTKHTQLGLYAEPLPQSRYPIDGDIMLGRWLVASLLAVHVIGIVGIGFAIGAHVESVPATASLLLAGAMGFAAAVMAKLLDIRRRDYIRVSQGRASLDEIDRLDQVHPKPNALRFRRRSAIAGAVAGISAVALAGWWVRQSLVDALLVGLIALVVTFLSVGIGSFTRRRPL